MAGVSRTDLLQWLNDLLQINYTKIEQCGTGAAYCQIFDSIYGKWFISSSLISSFGLSGHHTTRRIITIMYHVSRITLHPLSFTRHASTAYLHHCARFKPRASTSSPLHTFEPFQLYGCISVIRTRSLWLRNSRLMRDA